MKTIIIALVIGLVCMVIVLVSGLTSGVVRAGTIIYRTVFSFAFAGVASYFFMMLYDLYCELHEKKLQQKAEMEADATDTEIEAATIEEQKSAEGFQPMNVNELPNVEK